MLSLNTDHPPCRTPCAVTHIPDELVKSFPHTKRVGNYLLGRTIGEGSFAKVKEGSPRSKFVRQGQGRFAKVKACSPRSRIVRQGQGSFAKVKEGSPRSKFVRQGQGGSSRRHWRTGDGQSVRTLDGVIGNLSRSYGASPATWDHTVLPATRHR